MHQLEGLSFEGFGVEIHQTLQPDFCGLPEKEMLARAQPLQSANWQGLWTLDAEGMMLHSAVHLSKHLFAHGLKTAWDLAWLLDRFPDLDWNRLSSWERKTGMRRGFWVPVRVLCRELPIEIPTAFLEQAPRDKRQAKLETMARRHLFGTTKFPLKTTRGFATRCMARCPIPRCIARAALGYCFLINTPSRCGASARCKTQLIAPGAGANCGTPSPNGGS